MGVAMRILSLGAGVQSSTLALMIAHGEVDPVDCAIFADTGWEPQKIYDWLDWLETKLPYPVYRVSAGNIRDSLTGNQQRYAALPFFTENGGMGRRQCTREYKIDPIRKKTRELLGLAKGERAKPHHQATVLIGISTDEAQRMKPSRDKWQTNSWPLIDLNMSRADCMAWMAKQGYPLPGKSSCIGCPYHSNQHWREMRDNAPAEFEDACHVDDLIRANGTSGMLNRQYMHRSLVPLRNAVLGDEKTVDMFNNECEGMCGV